MDKNAPIVQGTKPLGTRFTAPPALPVPDEPMPPAKPPTVPLAAQRRAGKPLTVVHKGR